MNRLAVFASGSGTNAEAITKHFENVDHSEVVLIVTNKADAGVIQRAEKLNVDWVFLPNADLKDEEVVVTILDEYKVTHIALAGWLQLIPSFLIKRFEDKIVNIHPALLPKFGGKGMYGKHVHKAVFEAGEKESGITIHLVNEKYDDGRVLAQHKAAITEKDSPEEIEQKVRKLELAHYPIEIENWLRKN